MHDSEKAGLGKILFLFFISLMLILYIFIFLGISVKGKTSSSNSSNDKDFSQDLGIFIKNVIHGGAASRYLLT